MKKEAKPYLLHILEERKFLREKSQNLNFKKFNEDLQLERTNFFMLKM